jgi:hypothetical protein
MSARATCETQVYVEYARSRPLRSNAARSIALAGTPTFTLSQLHPCNCGVNAMTCNTIKHENDTKR